MDVMAGAVITLKDGNIPTKLPDFDTVGATFKTSRTCGRQRVVRSRRLGKYTDTM